MLYSMAVCGRLRGEPRSPLSRVPPPDYQTTVLRAFGQIADILQALTHDEQLLTAQMRALELASESLRLQRISYGVGNGGILNLLDAQRPYQKARVGVVHTQTQRYEDTI